MLIGLRQKLGTFTRSPALVINGALVNQVSKSKSLGVIIDENLTWNDHIDKLAKKIASSIAALKRVRQFVPPSTLCIYNALIQPHFDYCSVVWGNCSIKLSDKLQKLHNRAARVLTYSSFDTDASLLFESLGWKNLSTCWSINPFMALSRSIYFPNL